MQLRTYQREAVSSIEQSVSDGYHPAAQLATGTGKSLIIAELAHMTHLSTWVLTHSQELVTQNAATYYRYCGEEPGVVCAGLSRADYNHEIVFGTIQSVLNPALRGDMYEPGRIIVDEAHRINHKTGEDGMYGKLFSRFPQAQRIAMTATPWRMDNGLIYGTGKQFWFDHLCFKYTVPQGVADGWLAPLIGVETDVQLDLEGVTVNDDFVNNEVSDRETEAWLTAVAQTLLNVASKRKHIAVYCPTIVSAMRAVAVLHRVTGWTCDLMTGSMGKQDRENVMAGFKSGRIRVLVSVDTLTTGFDYPELDCLVCLRPTQSSSLWVQILGRGTRKAEGKKNCLILDFVGNLQRLGGVDTLDSYVRQNRPFEPVEAVPATKKEPRRVLPGVRTLAVLDPTSGEQARDGAMLTLQVHAVSAVVLPTRRNPLQPSIMVKYACTTPEGARIDASYFVEPENPTSATEEFFAQRRLAVNLPTAASRVIWAVRNAALNPTHVIARKSGRYWNVQAELWSE